MTLLPKCAFLAQLACDECPICYQDLIRPTTTTCKHTFCLACLRRWLRSANTCPCCRQQLYKPADGSQSAIRRFAPAATFGQRSPQERLTSSTLHVIDPVAQNFLAAATSRDVPATLTWLRHIATELGLPFRPGLPIVRALPRNDRIFPAVEVFALHIHAWIPQRMAAGSNRLRQTLIESTRLASRLFADIDQMSGTRDGR